MKPVLALIAMSSLASADVVPPPGWELAESRFVRTVDLSPDAKQLGAALYDPKTRTAGDAVLLDVAGGAVVERWAIQASSVQVVSGSRVLAVGKDHAWLLAKGGAKTDLGTASVAIATADGAWIAMLTHDGTTDPQKVIVRAPGGPATVVVQLGAPQVAKKSATGYVTAITASGTIAWCTKSGCVVQ